MATIEGYADPRVKLSPTARKALEAWGRKKEEVFGSRQILCGASPALAQPYGVKIMKPTAVLKNASLYVTTYDQARLTGDIERDSSERFPDGVTVSTGPVIGVDVETNSVETQNTIYYIPNGEEFKIIAEAFDKWQSQ